jgi:HK97 family phage major capsid protein
MNPNELRGKKDRKLAEMKAITDKADAEKREMTPEETAKFDQILAEVTTIDESLKRVAQLATLQAASEPSPEPESAGRRVGPGNAELGMTEREAKRFSILRAVRAAATGNWKEAGLELEASNAVAKRLGKAAQSFYVPYDVLAVRKYLVRQRRERRDLTIGTEGADVMQTEIDAANFIELLRNKILVAQAGATVISGLVGDVKIPRQSGGATHAWVAESGAASESTQTTDTVSLSNKTVSAWSDISRKFMQQSSIDADTLVENDLRTVLALAIDKAALHGSGSSNEPTGVFNTSGIGNVAGGTNGLAPTYAHMVKLEEEVAIDNADLGALKYITNAKVRSKLKQTEKSSSTGLFVWENGNTLNGYDALVTNQVRSDLDKGTSTGVCSAIFYGNWNDLLIGLWGGLDVLVDPYTASTTGVVRVVVFQDADIAVRHPESFACMKDALTT